MKKWIIGVLVTVAALTILIVYRGVYGNTKINGVSYNLTCSDEELISRLENTSQKSYFIDDELEKKFVVYEYDVQDIMNHSVAKKFIDDLLGKTYTVNYNKLFLRDDFIEYLNEYNSNEVASEDAYIIFSGDKYIVQEEIEGKTVDIDKILQDIDSGVIINMNDYIINPTVYSDSLEETAKQMNEYNRWCATYTNGNTISPGEQTVILNDDNTYSINDSFIDEQIRAAVSSYCTVGQPRLIKCSDGIERNIGGGTWGTNINYEAEVAYLKESFNNHVDVTDRTPIFSINYEEIGGTFYEVSIEKQHLWYYRDGILVVEADIVTGLPDGKRNTPTGIYYISECIPGKYLTGDDYRTWVNYWMRLTSSGVGLHDAGWQPAFGADVYLTKGSHGCINLPPDIAPFIFSEAYRGMPVIIY